jgi:hypothetical protein
MLLLLLVELMLLLMLMLLRPRSDESILVREHAHNTRSDLMVYNSLIILAYDVDPEFDDIVRFQLVRLALESFGAQSLAVDEGPVGALDVFNKDLPEPSLSTRKKPRSRL